MVPKLPDKRFNFFKLTHLVRSLDTEMLPGCNLTPDLDSWVKLTPRSFNDNAEQLMTCSFCEFDMSTDVHQTA